MQTGGCKRIHWNLAEVMPIQADTATHLMIFRQSDSQWDSYISISMFPSNRSVANHASDSSHLETLSSTRSERKFVQSSLDMDHRSWPILFRLLVIRWIIPNESLANRLAPPGLAIGRFVNYLFTNLQPDVGH